MKRKKRRFNKQTYSRVTYEAAVRRGDRFSALLENKSREAVVLQYGLLLMSKLASPKPEFFNPLEAMEAQAVRDRILANPAGFFGEVYKRSGRPIEDQLDAAFDTQETKEKA